MTKAESNWIVKVVFYALAIAVIFWTASLTIDLVKRLLPGDPITPIFALALFDFGCVAWLLVFLKNAAGTAQRAVSFLAFAADLIGVGGCAMAELFLGGQDLTAIPAGLGTYVVWGIGIFTIINVIAVYAFHIFDPDQMTEMRMRGMQDQVQSEAMKQAEAQLTEQTPMLAEQIRDRTITEVLARLRLLPGTVIEGTAKDAPAEVRTFESETTTSGSGVDPTQPQRSKK